jgi:hypothetical protein
MTDVERMVRRHRYGKTPAPGQGTLDTVEKIAEYLQRMEEATRQQRQRDRRAAMESLIRAKNRPVF